MTSLLAKLALAAVPVVPPPRSDVEEIDRALEEAFEPERTCGYCGRPSGGARWCSSECRKADAYDGSHEEER